MGVIVAVVFLVLLVAGVIVAVVKHRARESVVALKGGRPRQHIVTNSAYSMTDGAAVQGAQPRYATAPGPSTARRSANTTLVGAAAAVGTNT